MFDSKSPVVKAVTYAAIGLFVFLIGFTFAMPDYGCSPRSMDQNTIAIVNGERVDRFDFLRYRDNFYREMRGDEKMDAFILDNYIAGVLLLQEAKRNGFYVTDRGVVGQMKKILGQRDITAEEYENFFRRINMSDRTLAQLVEKDLLRSRFIQFIKMGVAVTPAEVSGEYAASNASFQVKYSFLGDKEMAALHAADTAVTDAEVTAEMEKNRKEVKDPATDRERVRKKLETAKLNRVRKGIIEKVDAIAKNGGSFDEAQAVLKGRVAISKVFKPGDRVADEKGQTIADLNGSRVFLEEFAAMGENRASRAVSGEKGLYLFTPVMKVLRKEAPDDKDYRMIAGRLEDQAVSTIDRNIMMKLRESAKIRKNLKTN